MGSSPSHQLDRFSRRHFCLGVAGMLGMSIARRAIAQLPTTRPVVSHTTGECWLDTAGHPIQAHGGGILQHDGFYYWYGENRDAPERQINGKPRHAGGGVAGYRSKDLLNWTPLGVVLTCSDDPE